MYDKILAIYRVHRSIRGTATRAGCSTGCVRKTLITAGIVKTPLTERIAELRKQGMSQLAISEYLGISDACVNINSPYEKCQYVGDNKTANAVRIAKCRAKMRQEE